MSSLNHHYYYAKEKCEFIPIVYSRFDLLIYTAAMWILNGVVLVGIGLTLLSNYAGTPAELALKAENQALVNQLYITRSSIESIESRISDLAAIDNEMYRSVLGLEPLPIGERTEGIGGVDPYADFDLYSEETTEILRWTANKLNTLERRINIQQGSFEEIKEFYNNNQEMLTHIPAIKPVNGIVLSGFGVRIHPVLQVRIQHDGLDFRANVGTPVYATGDAVVTSASRKSTYGFTIVLNHDFGYETLYAHLSGFAEGIRPGKEVKRGDLIGYSGATGQVTGPHLHYEILLNGKSVNPLYYLFANTTPDEYITYQNIVRSNPLSMD